MDLELTETQSLIQKSARDFATRVIMPQAHEIDEHERFPKEILKGLAELGLMAVNVPEELGGSAAGVVSYALGSDNPLAAVKAIRPPTSVHEQDPLLTMEVLAPLAITTHMRDSVVYEHPRGAAVQWVAMGDGSIDFKPIMELYRKLCPKAAFQFEVITGGGPRIMPYFEADFWQAYPKMPAADFARFVALAKKGHPLMAPMLIAGGRGGSQPPEYQAALKAQQRVDLERSFEYARKVLDVGIRWRG